jgi:hypothetical protein
MIEELLEDYSKLELNNGEIVTLEPKLNLKKLMLIIRDFNTNEFAKMSVGNEQMDVSVMQGAKAVYVAYRQANMNEYMSFDEFIDHWYFDMAQATMIYNLMMFKKVQNDYQKAFEKANKEKKLQK